jgi:hypothetical protein
MTEGVHYKISFVTFARLLGFGKTDRERDVDTKNWYKKGTDLWDQFGNEKPFDRKISSEDSVKMLAVGNTPSFDKRTVCALKRKFLGMRDDVARIEGRGELMTGTRWTLAPEH